MNFSIVSLFPEIAKAYFSASLMKKSLDKGIISFTPVNIRDFAEDKHRTCDDSPYGGGAGMVLKPEPLVKAILSVRKPQSRVIYMSPSGRVLTQKVVQELSSYQDLVLVCGRYEGIDQRVIDGYVDEEISVGDYILSSGEVAALIVVDSVYRLIDGVIASESLSEESHGESGLLEYPHYTRPEEFEGRKVPEVLLGGNHADIKSWRRTKSLEKTRALRPDLLWKWEGG